jgi:hypothetical protein
LSEFSQNIILEGCAKFVADINFGQNWAKIMDILHRDPQARKPAISEATFQISVAEEKIIIF